MLQYHHGGGANGRPPAAERRLLPEQVDGERRIADRLAAGQAARHDYGLEVTAAEFVDVAVGDQLHPAGGADLAQTRRAAGGEQHLDAGPHQGVDDGDGLDLFRTRGYQYQYAHLLLLLPAIQPGSALLFDGLIEALIDRHRDAVLGGPGQQEAGDGLDLGLAAQLHVLIHGRVIVGGELHHHHGAAQ
ncbi:hypothetical protein D3C78_943090 [compost metagenome]